MGAQVKREISIMKLVRHPYVVQLREVLASSSKIFLVCELITGGELFDKIVEKQVCKHSNRPTDRPIDRPTDRPTSAVNER